VYDRLPDNLPAGMPTSAASPTGARLALAFAGDEPHDPNAPPGPHDDQSAGIDLATTHLARGELDLAAAELARVTRLAPDNAEAFLLRGQMAEEQGEDEQALADYGTAVQLDVS
jgi:Tfp pilus assembly protein PilF